MSTLRVIPVGGVGETGSANCMIYETDTTAIVIDCGVGFGDPSLPGVNVITTNFKDFEPYRHKLKALVLTHGHEDHVGAVHHFRREFPVPVYATPFTLGIVRQKLNFAELVPHDLMTILPDQSYQIGDINIRTMHVNHSIPQALGLLVSGAGQKVVHLTDFKIDRDSPEKRMTDLETLKSWGDEGVDLFLSDSTNVFSEGWTRSESEIKANLMETFSQIQGRIVVCLFSSNVHRVGAILECAQSLGRKVALTGRSTKEYTRIAKELGLMDSKLHEIYDVEDVSQFADHEVLVLATGSQAEPRSVLQRLSQDMFKPLRLRPSDTLVMSSKMIPGNEGRILEMLDRLSLLGIRIIGEDAHLPIHASGHAKQEELREVLRICRPRFFMPIHGEHRHLKKHIELAESVGMSPQQCVLALNGDVMELKASQSPKLVDRLVFGRVHYDEVDLEMSPDAIRHRRKIGFNGLVAVSLLYDVGRQTPLPGVQLDVQSVHGGELGRKQDFDLSQQLEKALMRAGRIDRDELQRMIKMEVRQYFRQAYDLKPEVLSFIHSV